MFLTKKKIQVKNSARSLAFSQNMLNCFNSKYSKAFNSRSISNEHIKPSINFWINLQWHIKLVLISIDILLSRCRVINNSKVGHLYYKSLLTYVSYGGNSISWLLNNSECTFILWMRLKVCPPVLIGLSSSSHVI